MFSMYLLQEHNSMEYEKFLYILKYYIWCCWKTSIFDTLNDNQQHINQEIKQIDDDRTLYETHDISENHAKVAKNAPVRYSVDSTTV